MKTTSLLRVGLLSLALLTQARGQLGGALVSDLSTLAQTVKILDANTQQLTQLGNILGVSTDQLNSLRTISQSIGTAETILSYGNKLSPAQLSSMISSIPGLEDTDLSKLFGSNGALNLFSQIPLNQWGDMIQNPQNYYTQMLMSQAVQYVGGQAGLTPTEIQFVDYLRQQDPRYLDQRQVTRQLADLTLTRWSEAATERRKRLQVLSETTSAIAQKASEAPTVVQQVAGNTKVLAQIANGQMEVASQAMDAAKQQVIVTDKGNSLLEDQIAMEKARLRARGLDL